MTTFLAESAVESLCLEYFAEIGWQVLYGPNIAPDESSAERSSYREVLLEDRLHQAISRLNPQLDSNTIGGVISTIRRPDSVDLFSENWRVYKYLISGIPIEQRDTNGEIRYERAWLVDFENPEQNDFLVINQFRVEGDSTPRRPDIVMFINGIPIGVIELKAPGEDRATLHGAYDQLRTYAAEIPALLTYNALCVISTGTQARMGALLGQFEHYAPWKTINGEKLASREVPELEVLVRGVCDQTRLLDILQNFIVFSDENKGAVKRICKYHQFHAVNKAVNSTIQAIERGDGRAGVVWHTQGSGKSLEMLFYVEKIMRHRRMNNPTIVLLTDRNDLDDQLYDEVFTPARTLPETPLQAKSQDDLRQLLSSKASGGIVFSTMQKFGRSKEDRDANKPFPVLSNRSNIIVVADEAHRTQYGLIEGLARNVRDALPHAAFIGFTGTPVEKGDKDTRDVFGEYIDIYDVTQAVEDGATVRVFYEARLVKVELPDDMRDALDEVADEVTETSDFLDAERQKRYWSRLEAIVGAEKRIQQIAADIVSHWEAQRSIQVGKALITGMSRRICVDLYNEIIKLRPEWHSDNDEEGVVKVVITGSASDGPELNAHVRGKDRLRALKERAKNPEDPLEIIIVRDMWLTGFDSPSLRTIYVDKPMRGVGLMQAIARVNRTFKDKSGGLVVDYIGIAENLRAALADYTDRDRANKDLGAPIEEALALLEEAHEICCELLFGCPWREALESGSDQARIEAIMASLDHLLEGEQQELPERFLRQVRRATQAFSIAVASPETRKYRDDLSFFQALSVELRRVLADSAPTSRGEFEVETAIRQIISEAVVPSGVIDIYSAAGFEQPDISIINEDFAKKFLEGSHKNLKIELLRRILSGEVRSISKRNVIAGQKFSELLEKSMNAYNNRSLTAAEVVSELVDLAKGIMNEKSRGTELGLGDDELAFYDAVYQNDSAVMDLGDEVLKKIANELVAVIRNSATIDWNKKEQVRAIMRRDIRRLLTKYDYPPDKQESAIQLVMSQAELLAHEVAGT